MFSIRVIIVMLSWVAAEHIYAVKVIQNGVKPFINEIVNKSCFHVDL